MKLRAFLLLLAASTFVLASEPVVRKPATATEYTEASSAHFGVWTDPRSWKLNPHPANLFTLEFRHLRQNVAGVLMAEAAVVPVEGLAPHVLERGRKIFTKLDIVSQEPRTVCGKEVLFLVMEGTLNDLPYTIYGYYYSGPEGTVQSSVTFRTEDLEISRGFALNFLNGLQIGAPGAAPTTSTAAVRPTAHPVPAGSPISMPAIAGVPSVDTKALIASVPDRLMREAKLEAMFTGDPAAVAKRFQTAAARKDPFAMYVLGQYYASGTGVIADPARAIDLMKQAVAAGLPAAEICLGSWYVNGYRVSKDWKEAERLLRKPAQAGVADAEERLGEILLFSDPKAGLDFLHQAAGQNWALAEYRLGCCYATGIAVEKNEEQEVKWLQRASQHGNSDATAFLGIYYLKKHGPRDLVESARLFTEAAKAGQIDAQNNLGASLREGDGTPVDLPQAVTWFQKAADQGSALAQLNLGQAYERGQGVPQDMKQALFWYEKAAKQDLPWAEYYIGEAYMWGNGVAKDQRVAMDWFRKAANQSAAPFSYTVGAIYGGGSDIPQDKVEAAKWFRRGAEAGDAQCQEQLAICLFHGHGVAQDPEEGAKWERKAAESGLASAEYDWGVHNRDGGGPVPKNESEGIEWIRKSADQGYGKAEFNLGIAYRDGAGVPLNPEESAKWFRLAATHGEPHGENAYGYVLAVGLGVKQDLVEAYKWYVLAMAQDEADPKARAEVNKNALAPHMTPEQIQEAEQRAASFVPEKATAGNADPHGIHAE